MTIESLVKLYRNMSDLTEPECATSCRSPHSCCSPEYCDMAVSWAKERWNTDLTGLKTKHPTLPFMGPNGCVIKPHFRPSCTMHTCAIGGLGFKHGDAKWTRTYFKLRNKIEEEEYNHG